MKKLFSAAIFASILVTTTAFAGTFSSQKLGIEFESPSNWDSSESGGQFGSSSVFVLPADAQARTNEGTGISIYIEESWDVELPSDLSSVMEYFKSINAGNNSPYTIIFEEDVTVGGYPAKQITYTTTYSAGEVASQLARHRNLHLRPDAKVVIDSLKFTA